MSFISPTEPMSQTECIDILEQLIFDQDELVTYKSLSKELKRPVNETKKLLCDFLAVQRSKKIQLYAYYFLSGIVLKDGVQCRKIIIVSEDSLEQVKKDFKFVTGCHIYSLNKGGCRDTFALYNSQSWCKKWAEEHREYSAIKHLNIEMKAPVRNKSDIKKNDAEHAPANAFMAKPVKNDNFSFQSKKDIKKSASSNNEKEATETSNITKDDKQKILSVSTKSISESKDSKKNTLSSMWLKMEDKSKNGIIKSEIKGKNKGTTKILEKNNIMSMFSKQAEKNSSNLAKEINSPLISKQVAPTIQKANSISPKVENKLKSKVQEKSERTSQRKVKRMSKRVSDNESDDDLKPKKKKHRRICMMEDSESESENEEAEDKAQRILISDEPNDDVSAPVSDDSEEPIPPTPPVVLNRGKVWKTVQKTFEDEDGFLVAKQEKVLVSASDSDEDPIPSKNTSSKTEPKQNIFLYRKQASLTSFFKK